MCGIFGYFCRSQVTMQRVLELLQILEVHQYEGETTLVGGHGAGVSFLDEPSKMVVYKVGKTNCSPTRDLSKIREDAQSKSRIVLGHVRRASPDLIDTVKYAEAAQPYKVNCLDLLEIISAHNGKVENYKRIRMDLSKEHSFQSETVKLVDSEVIPHLFEEKFMMYFDEVEARKRTFEAMKGNNTVVLITRLEGKGRLHILHTGSTRGMHVWKNGKGEIILCSREEILQQVFGDILREGDFEKVLTIKWKEKKEVQQTYDLVNT